MLKELKPNEFETLVKGEDKAVVLKFTAGWCSGCQQLAPVVENVAEKIEDVVFYDVDVDNSLEFAQQQYGIMSIPTLILFKNGEEIDRVTNPEVTEDTIVAFAKR
ncbi:MULTISPECIES: thioredoxin family protein [Staphylococcus]|uniref:Thioredoxin n=1 Tax=Staphylococcus cohnii subsp. cohnii TaxID=74704 RepID=A0A0M2NW39_STACC|nr:thioredoxin family protein [Staphylococcus cohnii]KKI62724.1 Thioredoxin [Staphylococcus cohnii subsp. cohnii]MDW4327922.1 thioredoxin family protein [Staphylococcus saprophyticus]